MTQQIKLSDVVAPAFYPVHHAIKGPTPPSSIWLKGGRGSTKSSFASTEVILGMMQDPTANAVVLRRVGDTLRDSVYEQIQWAISKLGVEHLWHASLVPLRFTYRPTGQRIVLKGADDPSKLKSIKFSKGRLKYVWYEELAEFRSMEDVRTINVSLVRGTGDALVLYSYNPPQSAGSWVNKEAVEQAIRPDVLVHHSDYTTVPPEWLGPQFIAEAEHLKKINPRKFEHEFLGTANGTGAEVFPNVVARQVTDRQIAQFDRVYRGIDFGFASDPTAYVACYYNPAKQRLVIFQEFYQVNARTDALAEKVTALQRAEQTLGRDPKDLALHTFEQRPITADAAEPRTIDDLNRRGLRVHRAKKGPGSVEHGIKWLADLAEIIIDPVRCPNTLREFTGYEVARDAHGNLKGIYPDKDNHSIDAVRYATEQVRKAWLI